MTEQIYNGWSNYETWNVNLWLSNEESHYRNIEAFKEHANGKEALAWNICRYSKRVWPSNKTPDGAKLSKANFVEIAEHCLED